MRKVLFPLLAAIFMLALAGILPRVHAQELALKCSAPVNEATLGVFPATVTLWFTADVESATVAVTNANGDSVTDGDATVDGAKVSVALNGDALTDDTAYSVEATVGDVTVTLTFTIADNALRVDEVELADDCPAEEPATQPTEQPTEVPTEEPTEVPTAEPTEAAPALLGNSITTTAGDTTFSVGVPAEYVSDDVEGYFLFPVVVMAKDDNTIQAYVSNADAVKEYVVIFTTFTSGDLPALGLEAEATAQDIIDALIREDSQPQPAEEATVAGAPALKVAFANETSGKSGVFYLVSFTGETGTNYLLIQGSAPTAEWPDHEANFQAVIDSIALAGAEEE